VKFFRSLVARRQQQKITPVGRRRNHLFSSGRLFDGRHLFGGGHILEELETRNMLSITLSPINNVQEPGGKDIVVPLTGVDSTSGQAISYSFQSSDSNVALSLVSPGTPSLELNVTGTDSTGTAFSGTLILKLFTTLTPATTAQIENLVGENFYNGTTFARVLDGFVAQAGFTASNGTTTTQQFNDEFTPDLTFTSPGLLAMANAGADTNTNQFFITAIDEAGSTTPIALADDPQFLDDRFTIFGQLVSGFDTFEKIMSTNVTSSPIISGETSLPTQPITITSASIVTDNQDAVLMLSAPASEVGNTATITVTATDASGSTATQTFTDSIIANSQIDPPYLGTASSTGVADETEGVTNQTTAENTPVSFTLTSTDPQSKGVTYSVVDASTKAAPTDATVSINQTTGVVTLTPTTGFAGTEDLLAEVVATAGGGGDTSAAADSQQFTLTVTPTPATQLVVTTQPPSSVSANDTFGLVVSAENAANQVDPTFDGTVTIALANNAGGTLGGTLTATAVNGVATFSGLSLNNVATGYTLQATASNLSSVTTSAISVTPDVLVFGTTPTSVVAGSDFNLTLSAEDSGVVDTSFNGPVTLVLANNPGNGTLGGTLTATAVNGVATFSNLTLNNVGTGYTITASAASETPSTSTAINVTASQLAVTTQPTSVVVSGGTFGLTVAAEDANGNIDTTYDGPITVALANNPTSATLGGTLTATAVNGVATFSGLSIGTVGSGYTLQASGTGLAAATTSAVNVTSDGLVVSSQPPASIDSGAAFGLTVSAETGGTVDTSFNGTVTLALGSNPSSATLSGTLTATAVNGVATFSGLTVNNVGLGYTITATSSSAASVTTSSFNVTTAGQVLGVTIPAADQGDFSNDNYTTVDTPTFTANFGTSLAGDTVEIFVNGTALTTTGTVDSSGNVSIQLPAGHLAIGANTIYAIVETSTADDEDDAEVAPSAAVAPTAALAVSEPTTVTYAPSFDEVYTVPGTPGSSQQLTIDWTARNAAFNNEIGVYTVADLTGTVGTTAAGASGYAQAAVGATSAQVIFASGDTAGATKTITVTGGQMLGFYLIQNNTTANFLAKNPTDTAPTGQNINGVSSQPLAFFSTKAANPDGTQHVQVVADPTTGNVEYNWEDEWSGGDSDYNDVVMTVALASGQTTAPETLLVPDAAATASSGATNTLNLSATLASGTHDSTAPGDVGVYFVDNPAGDIGTLTPTSAGYLAAALASTNSQVLIASGTGVGTAQQISVPAGKYLAFYSISSGTTANFLTANPSNSTTDTTQPVAFLSFAAANPNQINHFNFFSPEAVATDPTQMQLHVMDEVFGTTTNFDDLDAILSFSPPSSSG
jgi:cyclophilin family peptidyl-prolyl cis-trans isomerase